MARKTAIPTGIDQTTIRRNPTRRGRLEITEARTTDGDWGFEHGEEAGTPWHIHHYPTGGVLENAAPTLASAYYLTVDSPDWVLDQMARRAALIAKTAA